MLAPQVRGSPLATRRAFLEKKGLTQAEIDEALRRAPDVAPAPPPAPYPPPPQLAAPPPPPPPQPQPQPQPQLQPPSQGPQEGRGGGVRLRWTQAALAAAGCGALGALLASASASPASSSASPPPPPGRLGGATSLAASASKRLRALLGLPGLGEMEAALSAAAEAAGIAREARGAAAAAEGRAKEAEARLAAKELVKQNSKETKMVRSKMMDLNLEKHSDYLKDSDLESLKMTDLMMD